MYIIREDDHGQLFADALIEKARQGVRVRLLYDWMGGFGKTSRAFSNRLRAGGVEVRCYNPTRFDSPFGWVSRDHRKMIAVDRTVRFVTGLCVGRMWVGDPSRHLDPWRDTGVEVRGPAVADIEDAFADICADGGCVIRQPDLIVTGWKAFRSGLHPAQAGATLRPAKQTIRANQLSSCRIQAGCSPFRPCSVPAAASVRPSRWNPVARFGRNAPKRQLMAMWPLAARVSASRKKCRRCKRSDVLKLEGGRYWCSWCGDWAEVPSWRKRVRIAVTVIGGLLVFIAVSGFFEWLIPQEVAFSKLPTEAQCLAVVSHRVPIRNPEGRARKGCPYPFDSQSFLLVPAVAGSTPLKIEVGYIGTVGGAWTSNGASVAAEGPLAEQPQVSGIGPRGLASVFQLGGGFRKEADWGTTIWGGRYYTITPSIEVALPLNGQNLRHKWITLHTSLATYYPSSNYPAGGFSNASHDLKRSFRLYIISNDDRQAVHVEPLVPLVAAVIGVALVYGANRRFIVARHRKPLAYR